MKKIIPIALLAIMAAPLFADPKDDVAAAASKLAASNYSWKSTMDLGPNSQYTPGPTEGKMDKDTTWLSVTFRDNTIEAVKMGDKVAVKGEDGWQSGSELTADNSGGQRNPGRMMARRMENFKAPTAEVQDLATKVKGLTKDGDAYSGDLTEEGAKSLASMGFGRRASSVSDAKGSVKFWIKDGLLTKFQTKITYKTERNGETQDRERTTTTEISGVGTTKVSLSDEAKKKLT